MIQYVAKFILPHQRQSKKFHGTMAPKTEESPANLPDAVTAESKIVPNSSFTTKNDESKHFQQDETNPQDETMGEKEQVTLNIDQLCTNEDLDSLKIEDPFMYYSIPAVKKAEYFCQDVNVTILKNSSFRRNSVSCPGRMETEEILQPIRAVRRKSCISFECHSTAVFSSCLNDVYHEDEDEDERIDGADVLDLLNV
mmetsp:Transcript_30833/g.66067  ORF Transcript_30833/g.66067 Transcript_30833/m.66067 type:complete len:197 (+) Transcript_30833:214-804(+)